MVRWLEDEAQVTRQPHVSGVGGTQRKGGGGATGGVEGNPTKRMGGGRVTGGAGGKPRSTKAGRRRQTG